MLNVSSLHGGVFCISNLGCLDGWALFDFSPYTPNALFVRAQFDVLSSNVDGYDLVLASTYTFTIDHVY